MFVAPLLLGYLRDKLAHFHLDDGVLKLDFEEESVRHACLARLIGMRGENPQHPHVAAHHHLVCIDTGGGQLWVL